MDEAELKYMLAQAGDTLRNYLKQHPEAINEVVPVIGYGTRFRSLLHYAIVFHCMPAVKVLCETGASLQTKTVLFGQFHAHLGNSQL